FKKLSRRGTSVDQRGAKNSTGANACAALRRFPNADELAHPSAVAKLDHSGHFGKQRVVLAPADILARFQPRCPLPYDNRTAGHQLSAEDLDAKTLRVGVAPVFRTA